MKVGFSVLCVVAIAAAGATASIEVAPGSVVRWPGEDLAECGLGGAAWAPVGGQCWYAIDLLTPAGELRLERRSKGVIECTTVVVGAYPYPEQHLTVDGSTVNLSDEDAQRAAREKARIDAIWRRPSPRRFRLPLALPIPGAEAGRGFGNRRVFNGEPRSPHTGIDFRGSRGTPVFSVGAGVVVLAEHHFFGGRSVFVDHGDELISMYMHFDRIDVEAGQEVGRGERLGTVGASGRATGPHLHFGMRWHGARIDPAFLFGETSGVPSVGLVPVRADADVDDQGNAQIDR